MVDAYFFGSIDRISPEAPVSVISVSKKDHRPGGAANVALNLKSLGASVSLAAIVGNDPEGQELVTMLQTEEIDTQFIRVDGSRPTTVKTRVISDNAHILRIDHESTAFMAKEIEQNLTRDLLDNLANYSAIIFEDYNKGLLTESFITAIIQRAVELNIPTVVDPKLTNFFAYKHCTLFKPNKKEIQEGLGSEVNLSTRENIEKAAEQLIAILACENIMVTLSEEGVLLKSNTQNKHIPAHKRNILDVSGAGDTVVSVAALCLAAGMPLEKMAELSNLAGGLVCEKVGVVPITRPELLNEVERLKI